MPKAERDAKVERILETLGLDRHRRRAPRPPVRAARSSASRSRAASWSSRTSCCSTSRSARSTPICARAIQNELKLLQRRLGVTFVFVTHAQSEALALSDRIVVMNAGRVEQISAPYELYTRPKTLFVAKFIGRNALDSRPRTRRRTMAGLHSTRPLASSSAPPLESVQALAARRASRSRPKRSTSCRSRPRTSS